MTRNGEKHTTMTRQEAAMKSLRRALVIAAIGGIGSVHAASPQIMTFDGVGPVRLGMSVAEVEHALGSRLDPVDKQIYSDECFVTQRADKSEPEIRYAIVKGRLALIDVWRHEVATSEGIGVGSLASDVLRTYGGKIVMTPAPYFDEGCEIRAADQNAPRPSAEECSMHLDANDHRRGMIFSTKGDRVTALHVGLIDALNTEEICQ
jgi:hypothetical protein